MTMAFTLYPAIDLKDGACVRLVRGAMETATIFNPDPADQARAFAEAGLLREAAEEFRKYLKENPNSENAKNFLRQLGQK